MGPTTKNKDKGIALAYIDARDVMDRLDDVCGIQGWQCRYVNAGNSRTCCEVGILFDDVWVWKSDGAGDTDTEAAKGAFSDAFKRAAVRWGIGRYLYNIPIMWVALEPRGKSHVIKESEYGRLEILLRTQGGPSMGSDTVFQAAKVALESAADLEELKAVWEANYSTVKQECNDAQIGNLSTLKDSRKILLEHGSEKGLQK